MTTLVLAAVVLMVVVMTGVWLLARRLTNAGIVDVAWTLNLGLLALLFAALGTGDAARRLAMACGALAWSLRLGIHLARRVAREHPKEDGRYAELRAKWGASAEPRWLAWCAWALFAWSAPALVSPALMLLFLLRVTGIPATEQQALRSRGEAYRRYQREVSAFLPWFPRAEA